MCALLKPIDPRFLPHSMTVFNSVGNGDTLLAVVIRQVNYADSNSYVFRQTGNETANAFRVAICCTNSDFGGREFVNVLDWKQLTEDEQKDGMQFTLYRDMWLFKGEHERFASGTIVPKAEMMQKKFDPLGLRLHKTTLFDMAGLEVPHNIQLAG